MAKFTGVEMEKIQTKATILIIPGLRDHVPEHWQTILETKLAKVRSVPPVEINKLNCENRVAAIQAQLEQIQGPVILVAQCRRADDNTLGCKISKTNSRSSTCGST